MKMRLFVAVLLGFLAFGAAPAMAADQATFDELLLQAPATDAGVTTAPFPDLEFSLEREVQNLKARVFDLDRVARVIAEKHNALVLVVSNHDREIERLSRELNELRQRYVEDAKRQSKDE